MEVFSVEFLYELCRPRNAGKRSAIFREIRTLESNKLITTTMHDIYSGLHISSRPPLKLIKLKTGT